ncbi:hypothetical protein JSQ81_11460 [Sporosarcina sp. Marseille-Q4063]|uniref:hypothetical protein n=1 Tax=Sporosarcina sp. Marseille-Q4063 TaxID=2810514 RepID=UPI001BB0204E|nr:hypothetical protein [Sporosarcina sp. Marseille-Q4063]QUW20478.1 hypothetical protein JSQ81_11460 [Sporosarcina sp. Marseille-Q4063]
MKTIELGIDLGSKFLTNQSAYFLGLLMADERTSIEDKVYWQAPVRHNPTHFNYRDLEAHYNYIKQIADFLNKGELCQLTDFYRQQNIPISKYSAGKKGIVTLFEQTQSTYNINDLVRDIQEPLYNSSTEVKISFLVGVFDGRASYDKTAKFIALDYDNDNVRGLLARLLNDVRITANINSGTTARERKDSYSAPRKKQIRIKHIEYLTKIGFVSPTRFERATVSVSTDLKLVDNREVLPGLKTLRNSGY